MAQVTNNIMFTTGGGGTTITVVANYSALPDPTTVSGKFYWCESAQGTSWLPGSLGGTYYNSGMYYSNGVSWEFMNVPYQATLAEVNTGTNTDKFVTPSTLKNSDWAFTASKVLATVLSGLSASSGTFTSSNTILEAFGKLKYFLDTTLPTLAPLASPTFTGTVTTPAIIVSSETASTIAIIDSSKNIKSADVLTYPSLTELAYVKGVTSSIQTQLNGKQPSLGFTAVPNTRTVNSKALSSDITLNTDDIAESGTPTNKWWTNARTIASTLTGFVSGAGIVSSSDTILQAIQKIVGNVDNNTTALNSRIKIISRSTAPTSALTGTTTETQMAVITIPAGTFSATDFIKIRLQPNKTTATSTCTWRIKISTSATMPSGNTDRIAVFTDSTGIRTQTMKRTFWRSGANLSGVDFTTSLANDDVTITTTGLSSLAFDNSATQYYIYISAQLTSASDSVTLQNYEITN